jgi:hypothetical protein
MEKPERKTALVTGSTDGVGRLVGPPGRPRRIPVHNVPAIIKTKSSLRDARSERVSRAAASRRPLPSAVQALVGCPRKAPLARDAAESRPRSPLGEACTLRDRPS